MKFIRLPLTTIALLVSSVAAMAQQTSTGAPQGGTPAVLQKGKIALVNTTAFQAELAEYKVKVDALNRQFEPRTKDIQSLVDKINALETTIKTQNQVLGAAKIAEMTEQVDSMKREYQRKYEDLQIEGKRAMEQSLSPLNQKVGKFLQDYTAKRGISILIDTANESQANFIVWADRRIDITRDFIAEYNKANPVAGAPANPSPQKPGRIKS